ncbi:MAG: hypothetical protein IKE08_06040 [Clostridia bacterium]|nr:hypothetical protein [Clostridia bacterium]MBR2854592.1 hypothetical protein [Clostridia bacterium]
MKVQLKKPNRIEKGKAGDIVEVSPARAAFLLRYGLADPVIIREQIETPEKRTATKKTTRSKK